MVVMLQYSYVNLSAHDEITYAQAIPVHRMALDSAASLLPASVRASPHRLWSTRPRKSPSSPHWKILRDGRPY